MFIIAFPLLSIILQIIIIMVIVNVVRESRKKQSIDYSKYADFARNFAYFFIAISVVSFVASAIFGAAPLRLLEVLLYFLLAVVAIAISAQIFERLNERLPSSLTVIFFIISIISILGTTIGSINFNGRVDFIDWLSHIVSVVSIVVTIPIIAYIISSILPERFNSTVKGNKKNDKAKPSLMQHYQESGLSSDEINYFREQMKTVREHIYSIEKQMNETAKLRAIEVRHNTINISKQFFQDLVKNPNRLSEASNVIYRILPSLNDLSLKYNEVNSHIAKNKQTYIILEKSAKTIEELAIRLTDEYMRFHEDTFNDLEDEVNLAKRNLNKQTGWDSLHSIDDILNDLTNNDPNDNNEEE